MDLTIGLFDPGMSYLHRCGLAGLYMSLKYFEEAGIQIEGLQWTLENDRVNLHCDDDNAKSSYGDSLSGVV